MIDIETVKETGDGSRFARLTAILIGVVAILAASLALVQNVQSLAENRANILSSRLTTDVFGRLTASAHQGTFQIGSMQRGLLVAIEGTSRRIVAIGTGDTTEDAKGQADVDAADRLEAIADEMGAPPASTAPLDPYALHLVAASGSTLKEEVDEQGRQYDLAGAASDRSGRSVLGLSLVALAAVLVGLAAVFGAGRAGWLTLAIAYGAAGLAALALAFSLL